MLSRIDDAACTWDPQWRRRLLTFVFVGGGFAGVEAIAELEDMVRADVAKIPSIDQEDVHFSSWRWGRARLEARRTRRF